MEFDSQKVLGLRRYAPDLFVSLILPASQKQDAFKLFYTCVLILAATPVFALILCNANNVMPSFEEQRGYMICRGYGQEEQ